MKPRTRSSKDFRSFIGEIRAKQRNLVWPDVLLNSKGVDSVLFKGSRNPPLVQRIGAWLFGLTYFGLGLGLIEVGRETRSLVMSIFGLAFAFAGVVVFRNGFGKRRSKEKGLRGWREGSRGASRD